MNFHNLHIVFPMKIKKKSNVANDLDNTLITVNNFFAHWIKEIDIKKLGDDQPILPTINTVEIYKYSDQILKHLPKNSLKLIENDLLFSKKKVNFQMVKIEEKIIQHKVVMLMKELMII